MVQILLYEKLVRISILTMVKPVSTKNKSGIETFCNYTSNTISYGTL